MSFILDALRKSEHERQRQSAPGIADLRPVIAAQPRFPVWAIALAVLLLANIVIVALLVLRNVEATPGPAVTSSAVAAPVPVQPAPAQTTPAAQTAQAAPASPAVATTPTAQQAPGGLSASVFRSEGLYPPAVAEEPPVSAPAMRSPTDDSEPEILEPLPTIDEMVARGTVLPPLHLDIHVYGAKPSGRFVFINQRKYREGAQLPEGPVVERITREGVVLTYGGSRFLMPRP